MKTERNMWICGFCKHEMGYKDIYVDTKIPNEAGNLCVDCRIKMARLFKVLENPKIIKNIQA